MNRFTGNGWVIAGAALADLRPWRRAKAAIVAALASFLATFAFGGFAVAASSHRASWQPPVVAGSQYLALGDSVTFGYEEPTVVPAPNYKDPSSFVGYPEMLASALHLRVANAACPGETSSSLINASAPSNGCENLPGHPGVGYRTTDPLHVTYQGSQLSYALKYLHTHHKVRLVSLMIGANDGLVCLETTKDGCSSPSEVTGLTQLLVHNLHRILKAIRHHADYKGQLVVLEYFSPLVALNNYTGILDTAIKAAAEPFGARIADGYAAFAAADAHSGGVPCAAGLLTQLGGTGACGIHPSYAGQALLAQAVEKVIKL